MSSRITVYPQNLKRESSDFTKLSSDMSVANDRIRDIQSQIRNNRQYSVVVKNLAAIISANERQIQSAKRLQKALMDIAVLYETTENKITTGADASMKNIENKSQQSFGTLESQEQENYFLTALWQAIAGDFTDEGNGLGIALSVIIGFVPYLGQIADLRDLVANIWNLIDDGPETKEWVDLAFTLVGIIPGIGDIVKHADELAPILKNLDEIVDGLGEATQGVIKHADEIISAVEDGIKRYNDLFDEKVIKKVIDKVDDMLDGVTDVKGIINEIQDKLAKEINKNADTVGDFIEELVKEYSGIEDGIKDFISDGIDFISDGIESIFGKENNVGDAAICNSDFSCLAIA